MHLAIKVYNVYISDNFLTRQVPLVEQELFNLLENLID
jgi:hypothetical protein